MTLIASLFNFLIVDGKSLLFGLLVFYVVYRVTTFYSRVYSLPPGPIPLPFVGNLFGLQKTGQNWSVVLANIAERFGPVFTVWYGESPLVLVTDIDLLRDKFKKTEFAGRQHNLISDVYHNESRQEMAFTDYGPNWEAFKPVFTAAVMRYDLSGKYNELIINWVDHTVDLMVKTEGLNKPFVPFDYIFHMILNINTSIAFGQRYQPNDPEYNVYVNALRGMYQDFGDIMGIWDSFPITKFGKRFNKFKKIWDDLAQLCISKFVDHYRDYDENVIRDFCDTFITAKNEVIKAGKESATYLTDNNLGMCVADVIFAGTDALKLSFNWILLHMLYKNEFLAKLRHEIDVEIGDRMPTHEDKSRCHYVMAFISEVFRHSYLTPIQVKHKAVVSAKLGEYTIPKGTEVACFASVIMKQGEHFAEPHVFRPERFLQHNGEYVETKHKAFIPFGVGRRTCPGEKINITYLFLVLVRFLQKTNNYRIGLHMDDKEPLLPDPNSTDIFGVPTKEFQISLNTE